MPNYYSIAPSSQVPLHSSCIMLEKARLFSHSDYPVFPLSLTPKKQQIRELKASTSHQRNQPTNPSFQPYTTRTVYICTIHEQVDIGLLDVWTVLLSPVVCLIFSVPWLGLVWLITCIGSPSWVSWDLNPSTESVLDLSSACTLLPLPHHQSTRPNNQLSPTLVLEKFCSLFTYPSGFRPPTTRRRTRRAVKVKGSQE